MDYTDSSLPRNYVVVTNLNTNYSPIFDAYCLATGEVIKFKVHKTPNPHSNTKFMPFSNMPFEDGDIVYINSCHKQQKSRKTADGKWEKSPNEWEWWIDMYYIANLSVKV